MGGGGLKLRGKGDVEEEYCDLRVGRKEYSGREVDVGDSGREVDVGDSEIAEEK